MRVAAIDCGTNSIRLLIADIEGDSFREVTRLMEVVRLGQGVDKTLMQSLAHSLPLISMPPKSQSAGLKRFASVPQVPHAMPPTVIFLSKASLSV
jgi:hypothetical protein